MELPCAAEFLRFDMTAPWELLTEFWTKRGINAGVHLAWQSDPLHDARRQRDVDVQGSLNFFRAAAAAGLKCVVYCGSTAAYVNPQNPTEPPWLAEETKTNGTPNYLYSSHKAEVDRIAQDFLERHPDVNVTILRGAMVLGPHTQNIVARMVDWPWSSFPWMFQVQGADPPLQFLSEEDMCEILFRAVTSGRGGIFNGAGDGVVRYSQVARARGKRPWPVPAAVLYPLIDLLWKLRAVTIPGRYSRSDPLPLGGGYHAPQDGLRLYPAAHLAAGARIVSRGADSRPANQAVKIWTISRQTIFLSLLPWLCAAPVGGAVRAPKRMLCPHWANGRLLAGDAVGYVLSPARQADFINGFLARSRGPTGINTF